MDRPHQLFNVFILVVKNGRPWSGISPFSIPSSLPTRPHIDPKMQVVYEIHGDLPDAGSRVSVLCEAPLTLRKVQDMFPFEGTFHFRVKVPAKKFGFSDCDYLWMDAVDVDKTIVAEDSLVEVQALAVNIPECVDGVDNNYDEYLEDICRYVPAERQPACEAKPPRSNSITLEEQPGSSLFGSNASTSSSSSSNPMSALKSLASTVKHTATNINLDTVKSGASSFWSKVKATAAHIQQQVASATEDSAAVKAAADMLSLLNKDVNTSFNEGSAFHLQLLQHLWEVQFPGQPFERLSSTWKLAGWQKEDPIADLKNSGLLALHCMVYLGESYPERAQAMLQGNQANKKNNYPFAIVGVNVTLLLAELFKLRESGAPASREPYGSLFADPHAFNEVFCLCFLHIDGVWIQRNAVRTDFGKIIGELKGLLSKVLERGPRSMEDFRHAAADAGMMVE